MLCQFDTQTMECPACGYVASKLPTLRECQPTPKGGDAWRPVMLGDLVERGLSAVGITKERVERAAGRPCGCGGRQTSLNQWGVNVQLKARAGLIEARKFILGD